jgi:hypothetical protein
VYTRDWRDEADVLRVGHRLYETDAVRKQVLRFKTDTETYTGTYYATNPGQVAVYSLRPPYQILEVNQAIRANLLGLQEKIGRVPVISVPSGKASAGEALPPAGDGTVALADVKAQWRLVLMAAKKRHPGVEAAYASGTPVAVDGNALIVGFEPMWSLIKDKADQPPNRTAFEAALSEVLGKPLGVRCQIITAPPSGIEDDPLIQEALRRGAVIRAASQTETDVESGKTR